MNNYSIRTMLSRLTGNQANADDIELGNLNAEQRREREERLRTEANLATIPVTEARRAEARRQAEVRAALGQLEDNEREATAQLDEAGRAVQALEAAAAGVDPGDPNSGMPREDSVDSAAERRALAERDVAAREARKRLDDAQAAANLADTRAQRLEELNTYNISENQNKSVLESEFKNRNRIGTHQVFSPQKVYLKILPEEADAEYRNGMGKHDVSGYVKLKDKDIKLRSNLKKDEKDNSDPKYIIPLKFDGRDDVYVKFRPSDSDPAKGTIKAEGQDLWQNVEFDFLREQWTSPEQCNATRIVRRDEFIKDLSEIRNRPKVASIVDTDANDAAKSAMKDSINVALTTIENKITSFQEGNCNYSDVIDELLKQEREISGIIGGNANREHDKKRAWIMWSAGLLFTATSISLVAWRVNESLKSSSNGQ